MTEQHKFKVGERVKADRPIGWEHLEGEFTVCAVADGRDQQVKVTGHDEWIWSNRFKPLPSPSQPASQWVEVDRIDTRSVWQAADGTQYICLCIVCPPRDAEPSHYRGNRYKLGKVGYAASRDHGVSWEQTENFIPRDSAEAPKDSSPGPAAAIGGVFPGSEAATKGRPNGVAPSRGDSGRSWDSDKYNGLDAETYAQLSNLDKRIAAARELLDRPAPVRFPHPHEGRSDRVYGGRRW